MTQIDIYTKPWCPYTGRAKNLLDRLNIPYNEINVVLDPTRENQMRVRSGRTSVPQIFIGDVHIGGSHALMQAEKNGQLQALLDSPAAKSA